MPQKPLTPCKSPGCRALTREGYCPAHHKPREDHRKQNAGARGYTYQWAKARVRYLAEHPWCAECARRGRRTPATDLDHITPHKGDMELFWDEGNWQGLCHSCHSRKTAREDGGFGNGRGTPLPRKRG